MRIFFKGFNYSQDGPGNRLVYHLQGCNMRCPWCSNPEGMDFEGGQEVSVDRLVEECLRSRAMFFSGGGVTFTGGEATVQKDELISALRRLREAGIHTALETNGSSPHLPIIQESVDYLIMDVKHYDADAFLRHTGVGIHRLLENYQFLCRIGRQLHVRIPLIHHINDEDPEAFAQILSRTANEQVVFELLPYHEYGKKKWKTEYTVRDGFVPAERIRAFERAFAERKLNLIHT